MIITHHHRRPVRPAILLVLSVRVVDGPRFKSKVMPRRRRRRGCCSVASGRTANFAEYVPMILILMGLIETSLYCQSRPRAPA